MPITENSLLFRLGVYVFAAMLTVPLLLFLLPPIGVQLPADAAGATAGYFVLHFLVFALFLRLPGLPPVGAGGLAILFIVDGFLVAALYAFRDGQDADRAILTATLMPLTIAASYMLLCRLRKLV